MPGQSLFNIIQNVAGNGAAQQAGALAGLNPNQAQSAIAALLPAIKAAMVNKTQQKNGLEGLIGQLQTGNFDQYLDNPATLNSQETVSAGNSLLGQLFGSKDVSRQVASAASQKTGLDVGALKKILPLVAAMGMAGLSRQSGNSGLNLKTMAASAIASKLLGGSAGAGGLASLAGALLGGGRQQSSAASGALGMLGGLLDQDDDNDQDDGMMGDVLSMAMKQFL